MKKRNLPALRLVFSGALLTACSSSNEFGELQAKMAEIKARPRGRIEPPPDFKPIAPVAYAAHQFRNPFIAPTQDGDDIMPVGRKVEPDLTRPKEYLERFPLDSLRMQGVITKEVGPLFALLQDPTGATNTVKVGDYVGKNFGRVIEVTYTQVSVMEVVPDGQEGWVERPRSIKLVE